MQVINEKSKYATVRIPRGMAFALEGFLDTKEASNMGFDSKTDVITAAVRKLMIEYRHF